VRRNYDEYIGNRFFRLTVKSVFKKDNGYRYFSCVCECGKTKDILAKNIIRGKTKSCGCYQKERASEAAKTHGEGANKTKEYRIWTHIKTRCFNNKSPKFISYGGRGITMCDRWRYSYVNFLEDMGRCPANKDSIDRIDNNGNYEPKNCRWADLYEQGCNMRSNVVIEYNGESKIIAEWARITGISESVLQYRVKMDWGADKIIETPIMKNQYG